MKVPEIGELQPYGELWLLIYDGCGHHQFFFRNQWNYAEDRVLAEVRRYYARCDRCRSPLNRSPEPR